MIVFDIYGLDFQGLEGKVRHEKNYTVVELPGGGTAYVEGARRNIGPPPKKSQTLTVGFKNETYTKDGKVLKDESVLPSIGYSWNEDHGIQPRRICILRFYDYPGGSITEYRDPRTGLIDYKTNPSYNPSFSIIPINVRVPVDNDTSDLHKFKCGCSATIQ